ncbi:MAG: hypothetical protein H6636_02280 [Anaerolineales bacterium]|nr:hypothetical protein [Anaerolineales bacterium]
MRPDFANITKEAQDIAKQMVIIGQRYRNYYLYVEHALLALIEKPDSQLKSLFNHLSVDTKKIETATEQYIRSLPPTSRVSIGRLAIHPSVKELLENSQLEANRIGSRGINCSHIFLSIIKNYEAHTDTKIGLLLKDMGITYNKVKKAILYLETWG